VRAWWSRLGAVSSVDPDVRRRGEILIASAGGLAIVPLAATPLVLMLPDGDVYAGLFIGVCAVYAAVAALARSGRVDLALAVMLLAYAAILAAGVVIAGEVTSAPLFCLVIVTLAGTMLRPRHVAPVYVAVMALMYVLPFTVDGRTRR
jgi:hypothetical protein